MAKTKLPDWLQKVILDTQGPMALGQAPSLSGVPTPFVRPQQMPLMAPPSAPMPMHEPPTPQPIPRPQAQSIPQPQGVAQGSAAFSRPMPPELRAGPYSFPDLPTMPTLPDVPIRNISAENRAQGKESLLAALIGGVLGGGGGAMAAMQGVRQGMQGRATQDMSERERRYMAQMQQAQREAQRIQQEYANEVGQTKAQMGADDDYNQRALERWRGENTLYNNEENRALREDIASKTTEMRGEIASLTNETNLTKAHNQFLLGMMGMGPKTTQAEAAKMRAGGYVKDVNSRVEDRKEDNDRADDKLDFDKLVGFYKVGQTDRKIGIDEAHKSWMQTNGNLKAGIASERLKLAQASAGAKQAGLPVQLTAAQQRAIEKSLATSSLEIEKVRNGAGMKPDPAKHPDEYKLWQARRLAAEQSAAELRNYYNAQAELVGMTFDGGGYRAVTGEELDAKRTGKGPNELQYGKTLGKITSYGYQTKYGAPRNDETPDTNSFNLIGNRNNKLRPGSFALSPDMAKKAGLKPGQKAMIRTNDGNIVYGYWDDTTSSALTGRVDFASPGGHSPLEGKKVVSITPVKEGVPTPAPTATPYRWGTAPSTSKATSTGTAPITSKAPKATPKPSLSPTPKPSFMTKEPKLLTTTEKKQLADYLRKKLKG